MTIQQTFTIPFASNIHSTDPMSAARALKAGYIFVFGISRSKDSPVNVLLYGYRKADKADIETELKQAFEVAAAPDDIDIAPKQADILSIWKRHALAGKPVLAIVSRSEEWIKQAVEGIKRAKREERKKPSPLGAQDATADKTPHKGYTYKTARALIDNVIAKRQPSLFDEVQAKGVASYVDQNGKPISLSPFQMKLVTAFAQVLDTQTSREDVDKSIDFLTFEREEERVEEGKSRKNGPPAWREKGAGRVSVTVDIPALARLVYSAEKVGGKQIDKVRDEIGALSRVRQQYRLKKGKKTLIFGTPLIHLGKSVEVQEEGKSLLNRAEIIFEDVFVYELKDKYSLAPLTLLNLWNQTGNNSELFALLLFLLQQERGLKVKQADRAGEAVRSELKKKGVKPDEIDKQVSSARKEALTYRETFASICERLQDRATYYDEKNGKAYLRKARVTRDLFNAKEALLRTGIISEYYETVNTSREIVCNFVLNDKWLADETAKIKSSGHAEQKPEGSEV